VSGGSPSPAITYIPTPAPVQTYQSIVPQKSYQDAADYLKTTTDQINQALTALYSQTGTPAELGAQQAGIRARSDALIASSIPMGDKYLQATTGVTNPYDAAYQASMVKAANSAQAYADSLQKAATTPGPQMTYTPPSWANNPDEMWNVKPTTSTITNTKA